MCVIIEKVIFTGVEMKILICDDEAVIIEQIKNLIINNFPDFEITAIQSSSELAKLFTDDECPEFDIVFMDIVLKDGNGIDMGTLISKTMPDSKIIFISEYYDKCSDIFFSIKPYAFLEKPINPCKLIRHIENIRNESSAENALFHFTKNRKSISVKFDDIFYIESQRNYVYFHLVDNEFPLNRRLDDIEKEFPESFIRCHKSYLVNSKYVSRINAGALILISGVEIKVSRSRKEETDIKFFKFKGRLL